MICAIFLSLSCEREESEKIINDEKGIIYELSYMDQDINIQDLDYWIGFRVSDPSGIIIRCIGTTYN
jgi:hypothetical protein